MRQADWCRRTRRPPQGVCRRRVTCRPTQFHFTFTVNICIQPWHVQQIHAITQSPPAVPISSHMLAGGRPSGALRSCRRPRHVRRCDEALAGHPRHIRRGIPQRPCQLSIIRQRGGGHQAHPLEQLAPRQAAQRPVNQADGCRGQSPGTLLDGTCTRTGLQYANGQQHQSIHHELKQRANGLPHAVQCCPTAAQCCGRRTGTASSPHGVLDGNPNQRISTPPSMPCSGQRKASHKRQGRAWKCRAGGAEAWGCRWRATGDLGCPGSPGMDAWQR